MVVIMREQSSLVFPQTLGLVNFNRTSGLFEMLAGSEYILVGERSSQALLGAGATWEESSITFNIRITTSVRGSTIFHHSLAP